MCQEKDGVCKGIYLTTHFCSSWWLSSREPLYPSVLISVSRGYHECGDCSVLVWNVLLSRTITHTHTHTHKHCTGISVVMYWPLPQLDNIERVTTWGGGVVGGGEISMQRASIIKQEWSVDLYAHPTLYLFSSLLPLLVFHPYSSPPSPPTPPPPFSLSPSTQCLQ